MTREAVSAAKPAVRTGKDRKVHGAASAAVPQGSGCTARLC